MARLDFTGAASVGDPPCGLATTELLVSGTRSAELGADAAGVLIATPALGRADTPGALTAVPALGSSAGVLAATPAPGAGGIDAACDAEDDAAGSEVSGGFAGVSAGVSAAAVTRDCSAAGARSAACVGTAPAFAWRAERRAALRASAKISSALSSASSATGMRQARRAGCGGWLLVRAMAACGQPESYWAEAWTRGRLSSVGSFRGSIPADSFTVAISSVL